MTVVAVPASPRTPARTFSLSFSGFGRSGGSNVKLKEREVAVRTPSQ